MKKLLVALAILPLTQGVAFAQNAPTGDAAAGKALWANELRCKDCHGALKLQGKLLLDEAAPHVVHKSRQDSEYCPAGIYFRLSKDGRLPRLSLKPL